MKSDGANYNILCENLMQDSPRYSVKTAFWVLYIVRKVTVDVHGVRYPPIFVSELIADKVFVTLFDSFLSFMIIKADRICHWCDDYFPRL